MVDTERLEAFLMSVDAPENCMQICDLHGFLTGILCSPDLIVPSEWLPVVWNTPDPTFTDEGVWAIKEILNLYNEIAAGLNADPPEFAPLFLEGEHGAIIATDWCEGFMEAYALRVQEWEELVSTEQGRDWMFPILAHLTAGDGRSLTGASGKELTELLDEASHLIAFTVPRIFDFWQSRCPLHVDAEDAAAGTPHVEPASSPRFTPDDLRQRSEQELFTLLVGHEDRIPMEVITQCAARDDAMVPLLRRHLADPANWLQETDSGDWWALLHAVMVLGLIPGATSAAALLEGFRRITFDDENDFSDWFAGYWPALFRNKTQFSTAALREMVENSRIGWYARVNAAECVLADAAERGTDDLETTLDWIAELVATEGADLEFGALTAARLLDFPRERHRRLLEEIAQGQKDRYGATFVFSKRDIDAAYERGDRPQWLRFDNPWSFYEPDSIRRRQQRWAEEDARHAARHREEQSGASSWSTGLGGSFSETDVRRKPKIGRNEPCPCGSGKKYKKCCLSR